MAGRTRKGKGWKGMKGKEKGRENMERKEIIGHGKKEKGNEHENGKNR